MSHLHLKPPICIANKDFLYMSEHVLGWFPYPRWKGWIKWVPLALEQKQNCLSPTAMNVWIEGRGEEISNWIPEGGPMAETRKACLNVLYICKGLELVNPVRGPPGKGWKREGGLLEFAAWLKGVPSRASSLTGQFQIHSVAFLWFQMYMHLRYTKSL